VLQLYRHDQGLTRLDMARAAGLCPHCYEHLEAGRAVLSRPALESLYVRLPVIAALMSDMVIPMAPTDARCLRRLRTVILALERLDANSQAVELMRLRLQLTWQEEEASQAPAAGEPDRPQGAERLSEQKSQSN
jgi:DNA-binding XRE family transcriptional regulator